MPHENMASCIRACYDCAETCNHCAAACLQEQDVKMMARCIALEDSDIGLRAAHGAGLTCIIVPDLQPPAPEYEPLAHAVVPSLRDAHRLIERLLPGPDPAIGRGTM